MQGFCVWSTRTSARERSVALYPVQASGAVRASGLRQATCIALLQSVQVVRTSFVLGALIPELGFESRREAAFVFRPSGARTRFGTMRESSPPGLVDIKRNANTKGQRHLT